MRYVLQPFFTSIASSFFSLGDGGLTFKLGLPLEALAGVAPVLIVVPFLLSCGPAGSIKAISAF